MNRDAFLGNIQQRLQKTSIPDALPERPAAPELSHFEADQLATQFIQEAAALKCEVYRAESEEAAIGRILDIFARRQAAEFIAWAEEFIPLTNLQTKLSGQGFNYLASAIPSNAEERRNALAELSDAAIGISGATAGLADTGSLVLQSGLGRGRLASLLPPLHIAILTVGRLFPTMAHFLKDRPNAAQNASNLVLISGPSRTADIEQVLTLGVHGPKELHIILI